jgi:hypothetical protein
LTRVNFDAKIMKKEVVYMKKLKLKVVNKPKKEKKEDMTISLYSKHRAILSKLKTTYDLKSYSEVIRKLLEHQED